MGSVNLIVEIMQGKFCNPLAMRDINEIFGFYVFLSEKEINLEPRVSNRLESQLGDY